MRSLSTQEIEVVVKKEAYFTAENVIFSTLFTYKDKDSFEANLAVNNKELLNFFERNQLKIIRSQELDSANNDFEFKTPSYQVQMNRDQYLLFEKYRDSHPEVGGMAIKPEFSKQDKDKLLHEITVQAWREADEIAIKKGLVLKNEYKSEEIIEKKSQWVVGPPASARYDHFKQPLTATYKFIFKTL